MTDAMEAFSTFTVAQLEAVAAFFAEMEEGARGTASADALSMLTLSRLTFTDLAVLRGMNDGIAAEFGLSVEELTALPETDPRKRACLHRLVQTLRAWKQTHRGQRPVIDLMLAGSELYLSSTATDGNGHHGG